ncbi:MAG TPA: PKD domain-containing protein, partial [Solirubrobacteraceae bacterium]|nr:PKD domain-containing protein [Solirubrobacteraceae bacterium]
MARSLCLLIVALVVLAFASSASAATPYDPDAAAFSSTPSADLTVSGACNFDTTIGSISGAGCSVTRGPGIDVVNGIGLFTVSSSALEQADTMEFVFRSVTMTSGGSITYSGADNLVIATLHDLDVGTGATVSADGRGQPGGGPGEAGSGPGGGDHSPFSNCADAGGGGSFGGLGGDGGNGVPSGGMYGSTDQSQFLNEGSGGAGAGTGSGCGVVNGGSGGGGLGLVAMGTLTVNGAVSANGTPPGPTATLSDQGGPGGGSGGAILLLSPHLVLANQSVASAKGGDGYSTSIENGSGGGGGGGGRITMVSDQPSSALNLMSTTGGAGGDAPAGIGLPGAEANGGSIAGLPFLKMSGPGSKPAGQSATFTATQAAGNGTLAWNFGDGGTGTGQTASHSYT